MGLKYRLVVKLFINFWDDKIRGCFVKFLEKV